MSELWLFSSNINALINCAALSQFLVELNRNLTTGASHGQGRKKENTNEAVSLIPKNPAISRLQLHKLIAKGFRAIGSMPADV